jgi:hypothetical protein
VVLYAAWVTLELNKTSAAAPGLLNAATVPLGYQVPPGITKSTDFAKIH